MTTDHAMRTAEPRLPLDDPAPPPRRVRSRDRRGPRPWQRGAVTRHRVAGRLGTLVLYAVAVLLVVALVAASTLGTLAAAAAVGLAAFLVVLSVLGTDRTGVLMLMAAYFTAAFYKGVAIGGPASPVTATDLLLVAGFALLFPRLVASRISLPLLYTAGVSIVFVAGLVASLISTDSTGSFIALGFWMTVMVALPVAIALWGPSSRIVDALAASFVAGQVFSLVMGIVRGNYVQDRYGGLATHPNYFAQSGLMALALLLYLFYRYPGRLRLVVLAAAAACGASVVISGSRAATVVAAVLVLMVPFVERSAVKGFVLAMLGAIGVFAFPLVVDLFGEGSSIARLASDDKSAQFSDQARTVGLEAGLDRLAARPLTGDGLIDLFDIHNIFLEVIVGIGLFGLAGYLMVLYTFARPLFGRADNRRLAYVVWAYAGFGATVPSLYDRSVWAVVALSVVAMVAFERSRTAPADPGGGPGRDEVAADRPPGVTRPALSRFTPAPLPPPTATTRRSTRSGVLP